MCNEIVRRFKEMQREARYGFYSQAGACPGCRDEDDCLEGRQTQCSIAAFYEDPGTHLIMPPVEMVSPEGVILKFLWTRPVIVCGGSY